MKITGKIDHSAFLEKGLNRYLGSVKYETVKKCEEAAKYAADTVSYRLPAMELWRECKEESLYISYRLCDISGIRYQVIFRINDRLVSIKDVSRIDKYPKTADCLK